MANVPWCTPEGGWLSGGGMFTVILGYTVAILLLRTSTQVRISPLKLAVPCDVQ